jgi:hypothetical protein
VKVSYKLRALIPALLLPLLALTAAGAPASGRIAGLVVDGAGTPQMGATISIAPELVDGSRPPDIFTDARGRFDSASLVTGLYTVRVTLAGFLPTLDQHVDVGELRTTVLHLRVDSAFASLQRSETRPVSTRDDDDWTWVLRGSTASRPILRWVDGQVVADDEESSTEQNSRRPRGQLDISAGSPQPGEVTNFSDAPTTSFAYDMNLGAEGHLVMAGAFSYLNDLPAGGFATLWTQESPTGQGSVTGMVIRQSELGPDGPGFRGARLTRRSQIDFSNRVTMLYGGEFVFADLGRMTSTLRPDTELAIQINPAWRADLIVTSQSPEGDVETGNSDGLLQQAMNSLNAFPVLLERNNDPVLASGWHQEIGVEGRLGNLRSLALAAFHDQAADSAVFGQGSLSGADVLPDYYSNGFAYNAGSSGSWGGRIAYRQKFGNGSEADVVYTLAGVLVPYVTETTGDLSSLLTTRSRQSIGGRVSGKIPLTKTQITAGYTWLSGLTAARMDPFGESLYGVDPFLNLTLRQPLPSCFPGHMVVMADFSNLLAQGYISVTTRDGQVLLIPAYRTFQGGLSFQF